ncbi:hypothetical protein JCM10212_000252 [Sporobolomyces blumeae]
MSQASPPPVASGTGASTPDGAGGAAAQPARAKRVRTQGVELGNILDSRKRRRGDGSDDVRRAGSPNPAIVPAKTPEDFERVKQQATILYDKMLNARDPADPSRLLYYAFAELPDPNTYPEYYDMIKKPVSFAEVKDKLESLSYTCLLDAKTDMNQIFVNAKRFNAPGSAIFLDAKKLHKLLKTTYAVLTGEAPPPDEDEPSAPPPVNNRRGSSVALVSNDSGHAHAEDYDASAGNGAKRGPTLKPWLLRKFGELMRYTDDHNRHFADVFRALPDKREWPDYYQLIARPISLDNISAKINARKYQNVEQFKQDVETCFENAVFFNEEHSQIWNDAKVMLRHFAEVMKEQPPEFAPPRKYNTAKRRAQAEAEARNRERATSSQPQGGYEQAEASQDEYDESGNESDGAGGYDGLGLAAADGFADPYESPAGLVPPLLASSPNLVNAALGQPPVSISTHPNALSSLAALAASAPSPQAYPQSLGLASPAPNAVSSVAGGSAFALSAQPFDPAHIEPRPIAKMPRPGEVPLITHIVATFFPSERFVLLDNAQTRQHSIAIPPSSTRIDFTLVLRRHRPDGTVVTIDPRTLRPDQSEAGLGEGTPVDSSVSALSRPYHSTTIEPTLPGSKTSFSLDLAHRERGLCIAEFTSEILTDVNSEAETYRIFVTK